MFSFISRKSKLCLHVYIENVFGFKDREERRKAWENALLMGKPSSNYVRVCGKHFKREEYICKLNSILSLNFEMIYLSITCRDQKTTFERKCHSFCKFTYENIFSKNK
jgi:hypothetical protein